MRTSRSRSQLSSFTDEPIALGTMGYLRARSKRRLFTLLLEEFKKSGITQAQLARRLNMDKSLVSRYLGTPANWEFETLCDFFFAICGCVMDVHLTHPLEGEASGIPNRATSEGQNVMPQPAARSVEPVSRDDKQIVYMAA